MKKAVVCVILLTLYACSGGGGSDSGGDTGQTSLRDELEAIRASHGLPALAAMRIEGDTIAEAAAVGLRAAGSPADVTLDDEWHLGSLTKSMTATLAARLVEQGVITWDTTVGSILSSVITVPAQYQNVRLDELLYHTSGLSDDIMTPIWGSLWTSADPLPTQRLQWTEELLAVAPAVSRGTYLYSNAGYIVAGAMLEQATGMPWETLIEQEVFTPLGMTATGFGAPGTPGMVDQPHGHEWQAGAWVALDPGPFADNPAAIGPAGTVHATLADYARYVSAHLDGVAGGTPFLTGASFGKLHTPAAGSDYALGWSVLDRPWAGGTVWQHAGSNTYWFAVVWVAPLRDFAVFAVTNAAGADAAAATDEAAALLIGRR